MHLIETHKHSNIQVTQVIMNLILAHSRKEVVSTIPSFWTNQMSAVWSAIISENWGKKFLSTSDFSLSVVTFSLSVSLTRGVHPLGLSFSGRGMCLRFSCSSWHTLPSLVQLSLGFPDPIPTKPNSFLIVFTCTCLCFHCLCVFFLLYSSGHLSQLCPFWTSCPFPIF